MLEEDLPPPIDASVHDNSQGNTYINSNLNYGPTFIQNTAPALDPDAEIKKLRQSDNAEYDMTINVARGSCTPETRTAILQQLIAWCLTGTQLLYWLNGMAGTGKTTIIFTICRMLEDAALLGASFFCSRSLPDCRDVNFIFPTIAYQLAQRYPVLKEELVKVLKQDPDILRRGIETQFRKLLIEPWKSKEDDLPRGVVVVLDALDECKSGHSEFLRVVFNNIATLPFKILISSRPDLPIYKNMMSKEPQIRSMFILHEVEADLVHADIVKYLESALPDLSGTGILSTIADLAGSLFVFAATLARLFEEGKVNVSKCIEALKSSASTDVKKQVMSPLDDLYRVVLISVLSDMPSKSDEEEVKEVLYAIVCAREPIIRTALAGLLGVEVTEIERRLNLLRSIIFISEDRTHPITTFHASLPEFILDTSRSKELGCEPSSFHLSMAQKCLIVLEMQLHQNLCDLDGRPPNESIGAEVIQAHISSALRYAALYWVEHWKLADSFERQCTLASIENIINVHIFHLVECLSLVGKLEVAVRSLQDVLNNIDKVLDLNMAIRDSLRLIQLVYDAIHYSAMEIYFSALVWVPIRSLIRSRHTSLLQNVPAVLCGSSEIWVGPERVINVGSEKLGAISISRDGSKIASGSYNGPVRVWNIFNQVEDCAFGGENAAHILLPVVAITGDGSHVMTSFTSSKLHAWSTITHEPVLSIDQGRPITSITISHGDKLIAFGLESGPICVCEGMNQQRIHILTGHVGRIASLEFMSSDRLISGSNDGSVRVWNMATKGVEHILRAYGNAKMKVPSVAASPVEDVIITCHEKGSVFLWRLPSAAKLALVAHRETIDNDVLSAAFVPNGKYAITGSKDGMLRIWDVTWRETIHVFQSSGSVFSMAMFPDGHKVATTLGSGIAIWDIQSAISAPFLSEKSYKPFSMRAVEIDAIAFSPKEPRALLLPSLQILNTTNLKEIAILSGTPGLQYVIGTFSAMKWVGAASNEQINVWKLESDGSLETKISLLGHRYAVLSMNFSKNELLLASASADFTVRIWDLNTSQSIQELPHRGIVYGVAFSQDPESRQVATAEKHCVHIWNTLSGELLHWFVTDVASIAYTPDNKHIITSVLTNIEIWDAQGRKHEQEDQFVGYKYWNTVEDGSSYALSHDGWVCYFPRIGEPPHNLLWIPPQYRPSSDFIFIQGPLFTWSTQGIRVCLPSKDSCVTLLIPHEGQSIQLTLSPNTGSYPQPAQSVSLEDDTDYSIISPSMRPASRLQDSKPPRFRDIFPEKLRSSIRQQVNRFKQERGD